MKKLPDVLNIKELEELTKKGEAIFFNYIGILPDINEQHLLKIIKGKENALVGVDLYTKERNYSYGLHIKDWLKTEEAKKYAYLFLKMRGSVFVIMDNKHYTLMHKNKHLN